jgi:hypothetical protein
MAGNAAQRVSENFGEGTFIYQGVQALDSPTITLWRMSLYGAVVGDKDGTTDERVSFGYVTTAPTGKALPIGA